MSDEPAEEFEDGVCVCCKASPPDILTWRPLPEMTPLPVCLECKDDGTFLAWLERTIEESVKEAGYTSRVTPEGKTVWTPPAEEKGTEV